MVESEDYKKYIANLRSIGCPEETIRDIIVADVNKLYDSRSKDSRGSRTKKFEYWKTASFFAGLMDEESLARQKEISKEKRLLLKELLGIDVPEKIDPTGGVNPFETMLDFLPTEKQSALMEIEQKYAARSAKAMKDTAKGDFAEMKKMMAEKESELAGVLTAEEKIEYDLRLSQSSMMMRMRLGELEPSEQEFRALFKVQKQLDDQFGLPGMEAPEKMVERDLAQKNLEAQFKAILGTDRYREYKYGMEYNVGGLKALADENNIPKANALKVFELRDSVLMQAATVRQNQTLTPEQRKQSLNAIRSAAEQQLSNLLGPAAAAYQLKNPWMGVLTR